MKFVNSSLLLDGLESLAIILNFQTLQGSVAT